MPRFFIEPDGICDGYATLTGEEAHHIAYSLRMAVGDEVILCDGTGYEYTGTLAAFSKESVGVSITDRRLSEAEPPVHITLYQGYPKADKLEYIVQKATETGVSRIVPFESIRCVKRPSADKAERNTERLSRIAREATKQCGRAVICRVEKPVSLKEALAGAAADGDLMLFCYEGEGTRPLGEVLRENGGAGRISLFVGCEGGFDEKEVETARALGANICGLGKRILRCETAPIFAASCIVYEYGL